VILFDVDSNSCGINFIDVYYRDGLYKVDDGTVLGSEAGGTVFDCSDELKKDWLNKRVVYLGMGGFAEYTSVHLSKLIAVPEKIPLPSALGLTTMGLTAHYLCTSVGKLKPGDNGKSSFYRLTSG
jgi:NADPH2:quinone reductase